MIGDYKITFMFNRVPRWVQNPLEQQVDLEEIKKGFWLTPDLKLTDANRGSIWIPPSQIMFIEKVQ